MSVCEPSLTPSLTMEELLTRLPGARRALFRLYHIGGCSSCGFRPDETVAEVCSRNGDLNPDEVLERVEIEAAKEAAFQVAPLELAKELVGGEPPRLVDIRTSEEFEAVSIPGSLHLTQPLMQEILGTWPKEGKIVLVDHRGDRALDAAAYFSGHGMNQIRTLRGGIDAWSLEVNPELPRYTLE